VLTEKKELPLYFAVMEWEPAVSVERLNSAKFWPF